VTTTSIKPASLLGLIDLRVASIVRLERYVTMTAVTIGESSASAAAVDLGVELTIRA
jgi:hypothetical protein